jgi:4'-phosphopantetheinyl transferase
MASWPRARIATRACPKPFCKVKLSTYDGSVTPLPFAQQPVLEALAVAPSTRITTLAWGLPPDELTLHNSEVHLWRASLDEMAAEPGRTLADTLSADERARAARLRFVRDRRRFVATRAWLRVVLGSYLQLPPAEVAFFYGTHGKPHLARAADGTPLEFNIAHAESLAVLAITRDRAVGVDVERVRPMADIDAIAARFYSKAEQAELNALPPAERAVHFFQIWTGKEASAKVTGLGLGEALEPTASASAGAVAPPRWLVRFTPASGFVGSLAVAG